MSTPAIRVLITDDHPVIRTGLRGMLADEPDIDVAAEASTGEEAIALLRAGPFDVVLMDLRMPGDDGIRVIPRILGLRPGTRIIVLSSYETAADVLRSVENGAAGYLGKDTSPADLADAIRAAHRGETVLSPGAASQLASRVRTPMGGLLSPRETEVLSQVSRGLSNSEIGACLFISEATVKTHIVRIFDKLGVSDRTAAVTRALELGMLPPR
ncbi:MAG TPA: response regulator transcription factor [Streptosporangiaceae bacterium]